MKSHIKPRALEKVSSIKAYSDYLERFDHLMMYLTRITVVKIDDVHHKVL